MKLYRYVVLLVNTSDRSYTDLMKDCHNNTLDNMWKCVAGTVGWYLMRQDDLMPSDFGGFHKYIQAGIPIAEDAEMPNKSTDRNVERWYQTPTEHVYVWGQVKEMQDGEKFLQYQDAAEQHWFTPPSF